MVEYVYGRYDFVAEDDDEISFSAGERIEVIKKDEIDQNGWWEGRNLAGKLGVFPECYIRPSPPSPPPLVISVRVSHPTPLPSPEQAEGPQLSPTPSLKATDSPSLDSKDLHSSAPTSRPSLGSTHSPFSTAHPLVKIAYSPLERLALTIEDIVASSDGTLTPDEDEDQTSWPKLERYLIKGNILIDPLAVLAAAARSSGS